MPIVTEFPAIWTDSIAVDKVDGKMYKVVKINPKNVKCVDASGALWNVHYLRLRGATPEETQRFEAQTPTVSFESFRAGVVVRFKAGSGYAGKFGQPLMVVVKDKGGDMVSLAWLGGNAQGKYFPTIPTANLERVDGAVTFTNV